MTNESAIQVVFKPEEYRRIKELARDHQLSASAYVRAQFLARSAPTVYGWWAQYHQRPTEKESRMVQRNACVGRMAMNHPDFLLERLHQFPEGAAEYRVFTYSREPFIYPFFQSTTYHQEGFDWGRVMLAGSHYMFKVINSIADERMGHQLRWLLTVDADVPDKS